MGWGTWELFGSWVSQSAFSSDSSMRASTQSSEKKTQEKCVSKTEASPPEGIKHQDYIHLGLWSGQRDYLKRKFLHWPSTTIMYPDSSKHPTFSLLYGISDHSSCSNDTPKMTEASLDGFVHADWQMFHYLHIPSTINCLPCSRCNVSSQPN